MKSVFCKEGYQYHAPTEVSKPELEAAIGELQAELAKRKNVTVTFTLSKEAAGALITLLGHECSIPRAVVNSRDEMPAKLVAVASTWGKKSEMFTPVRTAIDAALNK